MNKSLLLGVLALALQCQADGQAVGQDVGQGHKMDHRAASMGDQVVANIPQKGSSRQGIPAGQITGTLYTRNTQRAITPMGPQGPLGDQVVASGLVYASPNDSKSIGTFDLVAFTTSVEGAHERRQIFIELSIDNAYIQRSWLSSLPQPTSQNTGRSDISLTGVETYPTGGGILVEPIQLGISAGTGAFAKSRGITRISYDPKTYVFAYKLSLFNHAR